MAFVKSKSQKPLQCVQGPHRGAACYKSTKAQRDLKTKDLSPLMDAIVKHFCFSRVCTSAVQIT